VLDATLAIEFDGVEQLRNEARDAIVVGGFGCPSIDFYNQPGKGMRPRVNYQVGRTLDRLFLTPSVIGNSDEDDPAEFPDPGLLSVSPASG